MDSLRIEGGRRLEGVIPVSGSKNAALPILCTSLLADGNHRFRNVPALRDVNTLGALLRELGLDVTIDGSTVEMVGRPVISPEAPYEHVKKMRASVLVLGPLVARYGRATISLPGGCAIGARPVDQHLMGLEAMGAEVELTHGNVHVKVPRGRLQGAEVIFDMTTVTGTENLMAAATLAEGTTTLVNAAREPEVEELALVLNKMGASIQGAGTSVITIDGRESLNAVDHAIAADRIEAGTFMVAAAATGGDVLVDGVSFDTLHSVVDAMRAAGVNIEREGTGIRVSGTPPFEPVSLATAPYPRFPTDMQAQFMMLMCLARGTSRITETIFENRFMHVGELNRMGADIQINGNTASVRGPTTFEGAPVMATDLRASASLVVAGLVAGGVTEIRRVYHLDRGYEKIEEKLARVGAKVERIRGDA